MFRSKNFASPLAAVAAAAAFSLAAPSAVAAVVCNNTGFAIPENIDGVYVNLVTGVTGTSSGAVAGFDVNLYDNGSLHAYPGANVSPNNALAGTIVTGTANDLYLVMTSGQPIDGSTSWTSESAPMTNWNGGVTGGYLGIRFDNEATGDVNFGWLQITTAGSTGFPATVTSYCYDNTGAAINAGTTPVSLQQFSID